MEKLLNVRVSRSSKLVWEGDATSVTSENVDGPFDVLPMHANFLTLIHGAPIVITQADGAQETFTFEHAVMYVRNNHVSVFAEIQ